MNGAALTKTLAVHIVGLLILLSPASARIRAAPWRPPPSPGDPRAMLAGPVVFIQAAHARDRDGAWRRSPGRAAETGCPAPPLVDSDAIPLFPLIGSARPFRQVPGARFSPAFCIRIDRHGRVARLLPANGGTGDPAIDRNLALQVLALRFAPAQRHGAPVSAWHRLTINLFGTVPDEPPLPPREPAPAPMLPL